MSQRMKVKTTGQVVYPLSTTMDGKYTEALFPFGRVAKSGNRGVTQRVRTNKLVKMEKGYANG